MEGGGGGTSIYHMGEIWAEPVTLRRRDLDGDSRAAASTQPTLGAQFFVRAASQTPAGV